MGKTYRRVPREDSRYKTYETGLVTHVFRVLKVTPGTKWGMVPLRDGGKRGDFKDLFCHDGEQTSRRVFYKNHYRHRQSSLAAW